MKPWLEKGGEGKRGKERRGMENLALSLDSAVGGRGGSY